jgi:hypothetical protein
MLHRLTLRTLPSLALAVTEEQVRKKKRVVMLVPGLVAFLAYRLVKGLSLHLLADPFLLLAFSGLVAAVTALWAYRMGRQVSLAAAWQEDGGRLLGWVLGWIGFVYGLQLSLMVLALLKILAAYDFLRHPDGPAMMAIIIACTSVARDAFEIGHVRWLQRKGGAVLTFPDGAALMALGREHPWSLMTWTLAAGSGTALIAMGLSHMGRFGLAWLTQFVMVSLIAGSVALAAYLAGQQRPGGWRAAAGVTSGKELFRFWWWPGLAFAATYYLVLAGAAYFLLRLAPATAAHRVIGFVVGGIMALYCYHLGYRRALEDRIRQQVPTSLLRCPFVFGILSKTKTVTTAGAIPPAGIMLGEQGRQG